MNILGVEWVEDKEDGSSLLNVEMSDDTKDYVVSIGLEFILTCAAYKLDIEDAMEQVRLRGKYLEQQEDTQEYEV